MCHRRTLYAAAVMLASCVRVTTSLVSGSCVPLAQQLRHMRTLAPAAARLVPAVRASCWCRQQQPLRRQAHGPSMWAERDMGSRGGGRQVHIPEDQLQISFVRSSGAGGQNVNKVNTKVELRFVVDDAEWLAEDVRQRLKEYNAGRVNKAGELIITSQEHRTQKANRDEALSKLRELVVEARLPPKERAMRVGISAGTKAQRRDDKRFRGRVKSLRGRVRMDE